MLYVLSISYSHDATDSRFPPSQDLRWPWHFVPQSGTFTPCGPDCHCGSMVHHDILREGTVLRIWVRQGILFWNLTLSVT